MLTGLGSVLLARSWTVSGSFSLRFARVLSVGLSLGSSALRSVRLSPAFFTTTASADFCRALARQISPSKVSNVWTRRSRALPLASFGDGWISYSLAYSSPASGLTARSCSYDRVFAMASFSSVPRGLCLAFSLRLLSLLPVNSFHLTTMGPCGAGSVNRPGLLARVNPEGLKAGNAQNKWFALKLRGDRIPDDFISIVAQISLAQLRSLTICNLLPAGKGFSLAPFQGAPLGGVRFPGLNPRAEWR